MDRMQGGKANSLAIVLSPGRRKETRRMPKNFNGAGKKRRRGNGGEKECAIQISSTINETVYC